MTNYDNPNAKWDRPAIEGASPDEQRASFMAECYTEWEVSDDPAVQAMKWEEYFTLREYEVAHDVTVMFDSLEQMDEWFAEQAAIAAISKSNDGWLESIAQASDDAKAAQALAEEVEHLLLCGNHVTPDPDDADGEPGIIKRLS
jgi:hypothetical protein